MENDLIRNSFYILMFLPVSEVNKLIKSVENKQFCFSLMGFLCWSKRRESTNASSQSGNLQNCWNMFVSVHNESQIMCFVAGGHL